MCFVHNSELTLNHCSSSSRFKMTVPIRLAPGAYYRISVCIYSKFILYTLTLIFNRRIFFVILNVLF